MSWHNLMQTYYPSMSGGLLTITIENDAKDISNTTGKLKRNRRSPGRDLNRISPKYSTEASSAKYSDTKLYNVTTHQKGRALHHRHTSWDRKQFIRASISNLTLVYATHQISSLKELGLEWVYLAFHKKITARNIVTLQKNYTYVWNSNNRNCS
jgi:hypothetical protein